MSHSDDSDIPEALTTEEAETLDVLLDRLLAGGDPAADAPAWSRDVALLVQAARVPAQPGELAGEDEIVGRMVEVRQLAAARAESAFPRATSMLPRTPSVLPRAGDQHTATDQVATPTGESATPGSGVLAPVTRLGIADSGYNAAELSGLGTEDLLLAVAVPVASVVGCTTNVRFGRTTGRR